MSRRRITVELCLPVTVEMIVGTDDDAPSAVSDWEVLEVVRAQCDATPRDIGEHATDDDFRAIAETAVTSYVDEP